MTKIVECVPNISEGRDREKIDAIAQAAAAVPGVQLLDIDPGVDTNRTVITFAGPPEAVLEGAYRLIKKASELIDMSTHQGAHPRMGACDVCPFVPVSEVEMRECVSLAKNLGERVGSKLGIPVYLYEHAATTPERKSLADIRKGEYEALPEKLKSEKWKPDFGPSSFNKRSGATVIGARPFLIAYNVNLNTQNKKIANKIALEIRESGQPLRDEHGKIIKDATGKSALKPGLFQHCRAVGWYIDSYKCAQVSINLTDYTVTGMHHVFDACDEVARKLGVRITGSELVGLLPKQALLDAGKHYLQRQGAFSAVSESQILDTAVRSLGLSELGPFKLKERIIEERFSMPAPLASMSLTSFADELSSDSVAPGGGSVAALSGALAASLTGMVCALTYGKPKLREVHEQALALGEKAQKIKEANIKRLDEDTQAFLEVIASLRALPKGASKDSLEYQEGLQRVDAAYKKATQIPLSVAESAVEALHGTLELSSIGLKNALSDLAVSAAMAHAALIGGAYNVRINLGEIKDSEFVKKTETTLNKLLANGEDLLRKVNSKVEERMKEGAS